MTHEPTANHDDAHTGPPAPQSPAGFTLAGPGFWLATIETQLLDRSARSKLASDPAPQPRRRAVRHPRHDRWGLDAHADRPHHRRHAN